MLGCVRLIICNLREPDEWKRHRLESQMPNHPYTQLLTCEAAVYQVGVLDGNTACNLYTLFACITLPHIIDPRLPLRNV